MKMFVKRLVSLILTVTILASCFCVISASAAETGYYRTVVSEDYEDANPVSEKLYPVMKNGKWGFVNRKGKEKVPCVYAFVSSFTNGRAMVTDGKKYGIINERGKFVLPLEYGQAGLRSMAYIYSDGLAMVEKDGKFGFVDRDGKVVIPLMYESAYHFAEGLAPVKKDGKWGFINTKGEVMIPFRFEIASFFENGRAEVYLDGKAHKINTKGQCVKNCKNFYTK